MRPVFPPRRGKRGVVRLALVVPPNPGKQGQMHLEKTPAMCYHGQGKAGRPPCTKQGAAPKRRRNAPENTRKGKEIEGIMKLGIVESEPVSVSLRKRTNADKA